MDPISKEINRFRESFRNFKRSPESRIFYVVTEFEQVGTIGKALRAEEWQPDNLCPFLIFNNAFIERASAFEDMCLALREHYELLRKGLADQGVQLQEFNVQIAGGEEPELKFALHIDKFLKNTRERFDGLLICLLPSRIDDPRAWRRSLVRLLSLPFDQSVRFVIADDGKSGLEKEFKSLCGEFVTTTFHVDSASLLDYFKKLMNSDGKSPPPSVSGVLPGAARPDVPPPPRNVGLKKPTEEEIRSSSSLHGIPVMTPSEGERLRKLVFDAAVASGENRISEAIDFQKEACNICSLAGLKLEESLMTMVLASYYQQARRIEDAISSYKRSCQLAEEVGAYSQMTQSQMALGYIYMTQKLYSSAATAYELASESAEKSGDYIMLIEALRMAGICYMKLKDQESAERCWRKALEAGKESRPEQIRLSSFMDVATALIDLLNRNKLKEQARSIELLVMEVGKIVSESEYSS